MNQKSLRKFRDKVRDILINNDVKLPPVPVKMIARSMGVEVEFLNLDEEISGFLINDKNRKIIGVNSTHSIKRQRFTISHELGHFCIHNNDEISVDKRIGPIMIKLRNKISSNAQNLEEIEANQFAAELLMPEGFLLKDLKNTNVDFNDEEELKKIADKYEVSVQALSYRLINLGVIKHY